MRHRRRRLEGVIPDDRGVLYVWQRILENRDPLTVCLALVGIRRVGGDLRLTVMATPGTLTPAQVAGLLRQAADDVEKAQHEA